MVGPGLLFIETMINGAWETEQNLGEVKKKVI